MKKSIELKDITIPERSGQKAPLPPKHPSFSDSPPEEPSPLRYREGPSSSSRYVESSSNNKDKGEPYQATNIENSKMILEQLKFLLDDAVFLDEESFNGTKTVSYYNQKLQAAKQRIKLLSQQLMAAQLQLAKKDERIREEREAQRQKDIKITELNQQLENNAVVFKMHFNELIQNSKEIERLKSVIEEMSRGSSTS